MVNHAELNSHGASMELSVVENEFMEAAMSIDGPGATQKAM